MNNTLITIGTDFARNSSCLLFVFPDLERYESFSVENKCATEFSPSVILKEEQLKELHAAIEEYFMRKKMVAI